MYIQETHANPPSNWSKCSKSDTTQTRKFWTTSVPCIYFRGASYALLSCVSAHSIHSYVWSQAGIIAILVDPSMEESPSWEHFINIFLPSMPIQNPSIRIHIIHKPQRRPPEAGPSYWYINQYTGVHWRLRCCAEPPSILVKGPEVLPVAIPIGTEG